MRRRFPYRGIVAAGLALVLLGGCATVPLTPPAPGPWAERRAALAGLERWTLSGRIGVSQGHQAWSGSLRWVQDGPRYRVDLVGPLGQGRLGITGDEGGVVVRAADGEIYTDDDPDALVRRLTGLEVPLSGLRYWVRGLPQPDRPSRLQGDSQGRLTRLDQGGWRVEYPRYRQVATLDLPTLVRADQGELKVRLAVERWQISL